MNKNKTPASNILLGLPIVSGQPSNSKLSQGHQYKKTFNLDNVQSFRKGKIQAAKGSEPICYEGDGHLMTIAPTGAGKGRSVIIPNLLSYTGPVVVIDPKGENYTVTASFRRKMDHHVVKLDPFEVVDDKSDSLNPLDIFRLKNADIESDSQMLAELLSKENKGTTDPFWDLSSCGLYSGLLAYVATCLPPEEQSLNSVRKRLMADDVDYALALALDTDGKKMPRMAFDEIAAYLNMPSEKTRPSVLAVAHSYIKSLLSERVVRTLNKSTFSMEDVIEGKPLSIYLIIPPDKLQSHRSLLKLWVGTLLKAITSRKYSPKQSTLFFLDECGQLGYFPYLESVITLCRAYGLQAWSFWQDLSQVKQLYGTSWVTLVNNCDVLQIFGAKNYLVASELATIVGVDPDEIKEIDSTEQILVLKGQEPLRSKRFDYLTNSKFKGLFGVNPLYQNRA